MEVSEFDICPVKLSLGRHQSRVRVCKSASLGASEEIGKGQAGETTVEVWSNASHGCFVGLFLGLPVVPLESSL